MCFFLGVDARPLLALLGCALLGGVLPATLARAAPPLPRAHAALDDGADPTDLADETRFPALAPAPAPPVPRRMWAASGCSEDMVAIGRRFCIDRYEATMVDAATDRPLSPYPPAPNLLRFVADRYNAKIALPEVADAGPALPFPAFDDWQRDTAYVPKAIARAGVTPQGYTSRQVGEAACANAGKRLCTVEEWTTACRGERATKFPYGPNYRQGACNVFRDAHPAHILYGSYSTGHLDPRLNQIAVGGEPLLRPTGATKECRSTWGPDAVYDMVGNIDEWVDDPDGTFAGGFYSRDTRNGCDARVSTHPASYFDYSLGVRCCDRMR